VTSLPEGTVVDRPSPWPGRLLVLGLLATGLPALWVGVVALGGAVHRRRRRARAATPGEQVGVAWVEVGEALASVGTHPEAWETPSELAARGEGARGADPALLASLADTVTTASYAPGGVDGATADRARDDAATLVAGITGTWDLRQRLRHAVDPRPFLPRRAARRRVDPIPTDDERVPLRA
jgi:hypothetical protein